MSTLSDMIAKQKEEAINAQAAAESALKASEAAPATVPGLAGFNIGAHKAPVPVPASDSGLGKQPVSAGSPTPPKATDAQLQAFQLTGVLPGHDSEWKADAAAHDNGVLSESGSGGRPALPAADTQGGTQGLPVGGISPQVAGEELARRQASAGGPSGSGNTGGGGLADRIAREQAEAAAALVGLVAEDIKPKILNDIEKAVLQPNESNPDAPPRDLPPEITTQMAEFVEGLDSVYACFHDPDLLGHAIKNIMITLQKHPKFMQLVSDIDVATMVRGMRDTLGMVQIAKQKTKRKGTTKKGEDALAKTMKVGNVLDNLLALKV